MTYNLHLNLESAKHDIGVDVIFSRVLRHLNVADAERTYSLPPDYAVDILIGESASKSLLSWKVRTDRPSAYLRKVLNYKSSCCCCCYSTPSKGWGHGERP